MIKAAKKHRYNPVNERIKYSYRKHLMRVAQKDKKTISKSLQNIREFEIFNDFEGFEKFNSVSADQFIEWLYERNLSLSYVANAVRDLKVFFVWLVRQRGYRSKIKYDYIEYLNLSKNDRLKAKAVGYKKAYTYNQIINTIQKMPEDRYIEKRNKAIISLQACCALRVSELRTVKIRNIIDENGFYFLDVNPRDITSKFSKTRQVGFLPITDDIIANVINWVNILKSKGFKDKDPLFPVINNHFNQPNLLERTSVPAEIKTGATMHAIFKKAFEAAGYDYYPPHSFRTTFARYAQKKLPEFFNATRQNLGHSSIDTTFSSYGQLSAADQCRIISQTPFNDSHYGSYC